MKRLTSFSHCGRLSTGNAYWKITLRNIFMPLLPTGTMCLMYRLGKIYKLCFRCLACAVSWLLNLGQTICFKSACKQETVKRRRSALSGVACQGRGQTWLASRLSVAHKQPPMHSQVIGRHIIGRNSEVCHWRSKGYVTFLPWPIHSIRCIRWLHRYDTAPHRVAKS